MWRNCFSGKLRLRRPLRPDFRYKRIKGSLVLYWVVDRKGLQTPGAIALYSVSSGGTTLNHPIIDFRFVTEPADPYNRSL